MKKRFLAILLAAAMLLCAVPAAADVLPDSETENASGYVVKLRDDLAVRPMAAESDGVDKIPFADAYYTVESEEELQALLRSGTVDCWCPNVQFRPMDVVPNDPELAKQYYIDLLDAYAAWDNDLDGTGVKVAVIDTGICAGHEDLVGASVTGYNFLGGGSYSDYLTDEYEHGTLVAGLFAAQKDNELGIAGITPKAQLYALRVFGGVGRGEEPQNIGSGSTSSLISAVGYAIDQGVDVINMSLGSTSGEALAPLKEKLEEAEQAGILLVASAGNYETLEETAYDKVSYPAAWDCVISVGATNQDGSHAVYSFTNDKIWVCTPGTYIYSLGNEEHKYTGDYSGTSFAAPLVSAMAVMAKQVNPNITQDAFETILKNAAVDAGASGYDKVYGWGSVTFPNVLRQLQISQYSLTVEQAEGGTIALDRTNAYYGETVQVTVQPEAGKMLKNLLVDGKPISGSQFTVTGNNKVSAVYADSNLRLTGMNLTLEAGQRINLYACRELGDYASCYARLTKPDGTTERLSPIYQGGDILFAVTCVAKEMTDDFTINLVGVDEDGTEHVGEPKTVSIAWYAEQMLAMPAFVDWNDPVKARLGRTMISMLNYGGLAQQYFGYNMEHLASEKVKDLQDKLTYTVEDIDAMRTAVGKAVTGTVPETFYGTSCVCGTNLHMEFFLYLPIATYGNRSGLTATVSYTDCYGDSVLKVIPGSEFIPNASANYCSVLVDTLAAADVFTEVKLTVKQGDTVLSESTDSLANYTARLAAAGNEAAGLGNAVVFYGLYANEYFCPEVIAPGEDELPIN